jgi:hypothetical protein
MPPPIMDNGGMIKQDGKKMKTFVYMEQFAL